MRYSGQNLKEISFPIGGIGTGSIGLGGDGRLIDWEIFNRPSKGSMNEYSHFAIRAIHNDEITAAVLNGDLMKEYMGQYQQSKFAGYGMGPNSQNMAGFPHFGKVDFEGEFPFATVSFEDECFPAKVQMTAFNPMIPCDAKNSSIPAAFFDFAVENTTAEEITYQIAFSVTNPFKPSRNRAEYKGGKAFLTMYHAGVDVQSTQYGDLTIATDCEGAFTQTYWYRGGWHDNVISFWNEFATRKEIKERNYDTDGELDTGMILAGVTVLPGEKKSIRFVLTWNVPNNYNYWTQNEENKTPWKNYYATVFENSAHTAMYSLENWDNLYNRTVMFKNALYHTTIPKEIVEAIAANLSVLKSPTVLRLEDGSFYGWEGVHELEGSCEGTCQHVWNYAYAMCFLFPELERSIRDIEFRYSTDEDGRMGFRIMLPLGAPMTEHRACVDGQMGAVLKCYREWKISGDTEWLRENWENIKKVLEYAWSDKNEDCWDLDKDGVLEGRQHHTLDMELFGPSSWLEGMYLAALKAAAEMAEFLGDAVKAQEYYQIFEQGYEWTKNNLFNGKYFIQKLDVADKAVVDRFDAAEDYWNDEVNQIKYQICNGSSIDQLLAQWHADIIGLGDIFDREQVDSALAQMMEINYKETMRNFVNPWRIFALNDEAGTVICDYPNGVEKPKIPVRYCEETMTGFEYSFAGMLCARGKLSDGVKVVKAVRDRFDGAKRNPWNEFECGSNYARTMASYAMIPILGGFTFDMPRKHIGFHPYQTDAFYSIWSLADGWGSFEMQNNTVRFSVLEGALTLKSFGLKCRENISSVKIDGNDIAFRYEDGKIVFEEITIHNSLVITYEKA